MLKVHSTINIIMEKRVTLTLLTRKSPSERVVLTPSTRYFEKIFHNKILTTKQHNKKVIDIIGFNNI